MKEIQKQGRGEAFVEHTERTDRFRYEYDSGSEEEALESGKTRSLATNKTIYVMKNEDGTFTSQSHGVQLKGQIEFAVFKRGDRIK